VCISSTACKPVNKYWIELNWTERNWTELNWTELNWTEPNSTELNWTEPNWTELNWTELNWTQLNSTQLNWTELNSTELNWTEPNSTELNRTQLNWTELNSTQLNWTELNWTQLNRTQLNWTELKWYYHIRQSPTIYNGANVAQLRFTMRSVLFWPHKRNKNIFINSGAIYQTTVVYPGHLWRHEWPDAHILARWRDIRTPVIRLPFADCL